MPTIQLADGVRLKVPDGLTEAQMGEVVDTYQAQSGQVSGDVAATPSVPAPGGEDPGVAGGTPARAAGNSLLAGVAGSGLENLAPLEAIAAGMKDDPGGGNFLDALGQGMTLGLSDEIGGGIAGVGQTLANAIGIGDGQTFGEAYRERRDQKRAEAAAFAERNPLTDIGLQLAGGLAIPGAGAAGAAARGGLTATRAAGLGAGAGGVAGFGSSEQQGGDLVQDTLSGAALGGIAGGALQGVGNIASKVAQRTVGGPGVTQGVEDVVSTARRRTTEAGKPKTASKFLRQVQALDDAGVPLTPGQRSGNTAQIAADTTAAPTLLGGKLQDTFDAQGTAVRSKLMEKAGFDVEDLTDGVIDPETLGRAKDRFASRYTEALGDAEVDLSVPTFTERLKEIADDSLALLPFERKSTLSGVIEDFQDQVTKAPLTGDAYQRIRSKLGKLERSSRTSDGVIADLYADLKGSLDDAFAEAAGPRTSSLKKTIDRDYRNFKVLEKSAQSAGADVAGGEPTIRSIANKARHPTKGGTDDFKELADAAQNIVTDRTPNSGTPSRLLGLTAGLQGQAVSRGIGLAQKAGIGTGSTPAQRVAGGALATGAVPSIYQALSFAGQPSPDEEIQRQILLDSLNQAGAQLQ